MVVSEIVVTLTEAFHFEGFEITNGNSKLPWQTHSKYVSSFYGRFKKTQKYMMDDDLFFFRYSAIHHHMHAQVFSGLCLCNAFIHRVYLNDPVGVCENGVFENTTPIELALLLVAKCRRIKSDRGFFFTCSMY